MSDVEQAEFEQHLESCASCRQQLHVETVEESWWQRAGDCLKDDASDMLTLSALCETGDARDTNTSDGTPSLGNAAFVQSWLAPTDDPQMMGRLGGYEIVGVIGAGGMGIVLKGFDRALNRFVAIKVLSPHLASSGSARQRFAREAQAAAAVVHDNVVAIHGVAEFNGLPFLVMPYVRGISLQARINGNGALGVAEILRIGMQCALGLAAAHAQGLVHRDIKPANILLDGSTERILITDFGLARTVDDASLTHSGVVPGTPFFMSPEQAIGETVDHRSDLFSLGSVLYAMSTGRPPFRAGTSYGILRKVAESRPRSVRELNPDIPVWLESIIECLHAKSASDRFPTADGVAHLLSDCLAHVQHPSTNALPVSLKRRPVSGSRRWWKAAGLGAVAAAAIALSVVLREPGSDQTPTESLTERESVTDEDPAERTDDTGLTDEFPATPSLLLWDDPVFQSEFNEVEAEITRLESSMRLEGDVLPEP